jgi:hypothetical protein
MLLVIKKALLTGLTLSLLMLAGQAQAVTIIIDGTPTDIGDLDTYIGSCSVGANDLDSLATCVDPIITDIDVTADLLVRDEELTSWVEVTVDDTYALEIVEADYFVIKTGVSLVGTTDNVFVFLNNAALDWAYISLTFDGITLPDIYAISSVTSVVPVPAAVWLFGSALLGLVGVARRKNA